MRKITTILRLYFKAGLSYRQIAASQDVGYGTVTNYIKRAKAAGISWPLPPECGERELSARLFPSASQRRGTTFVEPDSAAAQIELRRKAMTLLLLWQEYRDVHPDDGYSYSQYCARYQRWRGMQKRSMRQVHIAGEKCFVDYAGQTVPIIDLATGVCKPAQIFVAVLGASGFTFAHASSTQSEADWIESHNRAFTFFGGVTELVVPDCLKAAVVKTAPWTPTVNASYQSWADHYGVAVVPARVRKPKDKAKAELSVLLVSRWILAMLRHHQFFSLGELNDAIAKLLPSLNERPFQRLPGSRHSVFESIEKQAPRPLPLDLYEYHHIKDARVHIDYHIEYDKHYYSVPHSLVKTVVEVRASAKMILVYARGKRVACHTRSHQAGTHTTLVEHMPSGHQFIAEWSAERFERWAGDIGDATLCIVRLQLQKKRRPEQSFRAVLALLALAKQYNRERLEAACRRALEINSPTRTSVTSIMKNGLDTQPLHRSSDTELQDDLFLKENENFRGPKQYV